MTTTSAFGLPSLQALDNATPLRIWLCTGKTDMRCGFDRLAAMAQQVTGQDVFSGHLFLFRNRRGDRLKILYWDRDPGGFVLWYKRLEAGQFKLPKLPPDPPDQPEQRSITLKPSELAMLLDGIDLSSVKRSKRYRRP
jgi:transposase